MSSNMVVKIAWRNVWRNRLRSTVVIGAIAIGLWAGVFSMGLFKGMSDQRTRGAISTYVSHVQAHNPAYTIDKQADYTIEDAQEITKYANELPGVVAVSERMILGGMSSSPTTASGVQIFGVSPAAEQAVTDAEVHAEYRKNRNLYQGRTKEQAMAIIRARLAGETQQLI